MRKLAPLADNILFALQVLEGINPDGLYNEVLFKGLTTSKHAEYTMDDVRAAFHSLEVRGYLVKINTYFGVTERGKKHKTKGL